MGLYWPQSSIQEEEINDDIDTITDSAKKQSLYCTEHDKWPSVSEVAIDRYADTAGQMLN